MLQTIKHTALQQPIYAFASFRSQEEVVFKDEVLQITEANAQIHVTYTISQKNNDRDWRGEKGRITEQMLRLSIPELPNCMFYLCGSIGLVQGLEQMLRAMGIDKSAIKKEQFIGLDEV